MNKKVAVNWAVAVGVAVVYLAVSIAFNFWAYSWIIWAVYGIYRLIVK